MTASTATACRLVTAAYGGTGAMGSGRCDGAVICMAPQMLPLGRGVTAVPVGSL